jgi:hypothetical protein
MKCRDTQHRIVECRNAEMNARSHGIQSNGAGEFEQDRRATVARHSETARNH